MESERDASWYYLKGSERVGPVTAGVLIGELTSRSIPPDTLVWHPDHENWRPAVSVELLTVEVAAGPGVSTPAAPQAPSSADPDRAGRIEKLRSGQKFVIFSILLCLAATIAVSIVDSSSGGFTLLISGLMAVGGFVGIILGCIGIVRLMTGLQLNLVLIIILILALFVPLVGLIVLFVLNALATTELRKAGYKVGLFGASK